MRSYLVRGNLQIILILLILSACQPTPAAVPAATIGVEESPTLTETAPAIQEPSIEPSETPVPTATDVIETKPELVTCPVDACGAPLVWRLIDGQYQRFNWPFEIGNPYALASDGKLLYSSFFPNEGLGPGNVSAGDLILYDLQNDRHQTIFSTAGVVEAVWGPDNDSFAYVLATETTYELRWHSLSANSDNLLAVDAAFTFSVSPKGDKVVFTRESGYETGGEPGVYVVNIDGSDERRLSSIDRNGQGGINDMPVWAPDQSYVIVSADSGQGFQLHLLAIDGSMDNVLSVSPTISDQIQGKTIGPQILWVVDRTTVITTILPGMLSAEPERVVILKFDQDLKTIVSVDEIAAGTARAAGWNEEGKSIWVVSQEGELTSAELPAPGSAALEPLAPYIVCYACGATSAWRRPDFSQGEFEPKLVQMPAQAGHPYDITPDGLVLAGSRFPDKGAGPGNTSVTDLLIADLSSGDVSTVIPEERVVKAFWAPDGQSFIYLYAQDQTYELHWRSLSEEKDQVLARDVSLMASFSPDGRQVAFTRESGYNMNVTPGLFVYDLSTGQERQIATVDRGGFGGVDELPRWSPDGKWIIMTVNKANVGDVMVRAATEGAIDEVEISIAPQVQNYFTSNDLGNYFLWLPDGRHLIADLYKGMISDDEQRIVIVELNEELTQIVGVDVRFTGDAMLVGWDSYGYSLWTKTADDRLLTLLLP